MDHPRSPPDTKPGSHRQARGARTRAAILEAAERVFAEAGLAGARTETIAAAAGVNKAMLFYHFKSKRRLYEAVLENQFEKFNRRALAVLDQPGSARAILFSYVDLQFEFISQFHRYAPLFQRLMLSDRDESLEHLVRKHFAPRAKALDRLLERGMRDGEFRAADRSHTAISLAALVVFYFSAARVVRLLAQIDAYSASSLVRRKQEVCDFIRYGLFADPEAPVP